MTTVSQFQLNFEPVNTTLPSVWKLKVVITVLLNLCKISDLQVMQEILHSKSVGGISKQQIVA